jgi:hypothetical protein
MLFRTAIRGAVAAAAILFLTSVASMAQDFRGTIIGTVSDRTGGVLSGVTVTITNTETQVVQTVVTDAQGLYQVRYLNPGLCRGGRAAGFQEMFAHRQRRPGRRRAPG